MLYVLGLFVVLELFTNNVVEPLTYGHRIGVSSVALVVALAFWTWLWGPVGLVLATPLTVCLAVLGKYFPQLEFINVLMSDRPALESDVRYYQRLLARDQDEATDVVETYLADRQAETGGFAEEVYDELLLPALTAARQAGGAVRGLAGAGGAGGGAVAAQAAARALPGVEGGGGAAGRGGGGRGEGPQDPDGGRRGRRRLHAAGGVRPGGPAHPPAPQAA